MEPPQARLTSKLTGVVAKPDLSITEADRGYNVRVECEVRRDLDRKEIQG